MANLLLCEEVVQTVNGVKVSEKNLFSVVKGVLIASRIVPPAQGILQCFANNKGGLFHVSHKNH